MAWLAKERAARSGQSGRRLFRFGFGRHFSAFKIGEPPLALFNLVGLCAHNCLYFANAVLVVWAANMKFATIWFNIYLVTVAACLVSGCQSGKAGKNKTASTMRLHLEVNPDGTDKNGPVSVHREQPFLVNVERQPFLTEHHIVNAAVVDDPPAGFHLSIQFDRQGTWLLEQYTIASKGKRIAIFSHFGHPTEDEKGEARWLGAPAITQRIADGILSFTPDVTREEAESIARGLNNIAKGNQKYNP